MTRTGKAQSARFPWGRFVAVLVCTWVGVVWSTSSAEGSPFVITMLAADSGSPGDVGGSGTGGGAAGSRTRGTDADRLGLALGTNAVGPGAFKVSSDALSLNSSMRPVGVPNQGGESVSQLDLGDGEYLSVSGEVGESIVGSTGETMDPPSHPPTHSVANDVIGTSGVEAPASGNNVAPDLINTVLRDVAAGIASSPAAGATNSSLTGNGLVAPQDVTAASTPEPATLVLLASALAFAARRLRRRHA